MSDINAARHTTVRVIFDGTDITKDIMPYLLSLKYTDCEEDETDDLSITLQDRDGVWLSSWLAYAIDASAANRKISADIIRCNFDGEGEEKELPCGEFQLDSVDVSAPPLTVTMRATSLPFASTVRQTDKYRAWESYDLKGIAKEIANNAGLVLLWSAQGNPEYEREEQFCESDIAFLSTLCHNAGLSLKATDKMIVISGQAEYESASPIGTFTYGDGSYIKFSLSTGEADAQYSSCVVKYTDSETGECISGKADNPTAKNEQVLCLTEKVNSVGEAQELASKRLRLKNKFEMTASFTVPGDVSACAGLTKTLSGFGAWDGKYIIKQAVHSVGSGGYTTQMSLRKVLEGY